jgi:hypothetical protein
LSASAETEMVHVAAKSKKAMQDPERDTNAWNTHSKSRRQCWRVTIDGALAVG